jgi:uncharacterized protein YuzE
MRKPRALDIDFEADAGYIRYADGEVAGTIDVWEDGQVAADVDASNEVLGIEILGFDDETLAQARRFADERGLAFPVNLRGALVAA